MRSAQIAALVVLAGLLSCADDRGFRKAHDRAQQDCADMQNLLAILKLNDAGKIKEAQRRFAEGAPHNLVFAQEIASALEHGDVVESKRLIDSDINSWICARAASSQQPPFAALLDVPERLRFLQELAVYRASTSNLTSVAPLSSTAASGEYVARILEKAMARKLPQAPGRQGHPDLKVGSE